MADSSDAIDLGGGSPGLPEPFLVSTPEALRAFAHPLRQRLIHELSILKHARAADLAEVLDEPANAISFHLRALARAGLITEAPEHARDRRDRVWKPVAESYALDRKVPGWAAAVDPLLQWVRHTVLDPVTDESVHRQLTATQLTITAKEAEELSAEVAAVVSRWHDRAAERARAGSDGEGLARYQVILTVGPVSDAP